jgi:TatD DNase family protein
MIDTHAHLYLEQFANDIEQVVAEAQDAGVEKVLLPNIDSGSIDSMNRLVESNSQYFYPMIGLHPCSVGENVKEELKRVEKELDSSHHYIAVGEIGTDLYWDKTFWKQQQEAFNHQCKLALAYKLPVAIHCRESIDETIELIRPFAEKGLTGVFHCFTGTLDQARTITDLGFYLGIGGVATFKNGGLHAVLPFVDPNRLLLETDSPYLAPSPHRGKRNEPKYLTHILARLAEYLSIDSLTLDRLTSANAIRLFTKIRTT